MSQRFTDAAGREWVLEATVSALLRVRARTGIDLLDRFLGAGKDEAVALTALEAADAAWAMLEPEARARRTAVGREAFLDGLAFPDLARLRSALLEAVLDFFPRAAAATPTAPATPAPPSAAP